jgi:hypothetical protein
MCFVMRKVKSHWPAGDVYLSTSALTSMDRAYHKIWGWVKSSGPTATSWGWGEAYEIVEKMKGKLLYRSAGLLHNNDKATPLARRRALSRHHRSPLTKDQLFRYEDTFIPRQGEAL